MKWVANENRWKFFHTAAWIVLSATFIRYISSGFPIQRGLIFFIGIGVVCTAFATDVLISDTLTRCQMMSIAGGVLLAGFVLRWTMYDQMGIVTGDLTAHLTHTSEIVASARVPPSIGTYTESPYFPIVLAVFHFIFDVKIIEILTITITAASFLPYLIGAAAYTATGDSHTGIIAMILSAPFVLFIRAAAVAETEFLVLLWFGSLAILLIRSHQGCGSRLQGVFIFLIVTAVFLHPFYALVFVYIVIAMDLLDRLAGKTISWYTKKSYQVLTLIGLIAAVALGIRIFWTSTRNYVLYNINVISFTLSIEQAIDTVLSPPGAVGKSVGSRSASRGSSGGGILKFAQPFILLAIAGYGWTCTILDRRRTNQSLVAVGATIISLGAIATFGSFHSNIGFRTYYFVCGVAIVLAAVAMVSVTNSESPIAYSPVSSYIDQQRFARILLVGLVGLVFVFSVIGPVSPVGNNVDPLLGGDRHAELQTEFDETTRLISFSPDADNPYAPHFTYLDVYKKGPPRQSRSCRYKHQIWDGAVLTACLKTEAI